MGSAQKVTPCPTQPKSHKLVQHPGSAQKRTFNLDLRMLVFFSDMLDKAQKRTFNLDLRTSNACHFSDTQK